MEERKTFTYDGMNSADFGLYIAGDSVYDAPTRDMDMITIPGRNGQLSIDQGRFENITVTYPCFIWADTQEEFRTKVRAIRNWLCAKTSYFKLSDEYNPESYRLGIYKSGLEVEPIFYNRAGRFELSFDCKPQRFLLSGDEPITLGEWGETETYSGLIVSFDGTETTAIKSLKVNITPKQSGSGDPSPSNVRPISGWDEVEAFNSPVAPNEYKQIIIECNREGSGTASLDNIRPIHGIDLLRDNDNYWWFGDGYLDTTLKRVTMTSMRIVLTGDNYTLSDATTTSAGFRCRFSTSIVPYANRITNSSNQFSSHARYYTAGGVGNAVSESRFMAYGTSNYVYFYLNGYDTVDATNEYLLEQSAQGTPFTIWLNCEEPQTYDLSDTEYQRLLGLLNITSYPTSLPQTVYGGVLDVVSGELTAFPYYSSYNGQTLNGEWICDRAVYSQGTTPPTGSQVVDMSGTGTELTLTPTEVKTLLGANNIWADAGTVDVEVGENPNILTNPTPFTAQPVFEVEGSGTLTVGNVSMTIANNGTTVIDSEMMEAYEEENGAIVSRNDMVSGEFPTLKEGNNNIGTVGLTSVKVTPKWWEV